MRLSAVMVSSWRAGKLSSDRAGASASRPKSLSLDVHLDVTLRAKIHDLTQTEITFLFLRFNPRRAEALDWVTNETPYTYFLTYLSQINASE